MAQPILHPGHKQRLTLSLLAAGCANNGTSDPLPRIQSSPRVNDIYQNRSPGVVRYDRYPLLSTRPDDAQRDPLNQMVEITMPAQLVHTVGDGFRYVLHISPHSDRRFEAINELVGKYHLTRMGTNSYRPRSFYLNAGDELIAALEGGATLRIVVNS